MVGLVRTLSALAALAVLSTPAHGFGWCAARISYYYPVYYTAAPVYYYTPVYVAAPPVVCPVRTLTTVAPYATPMPAPPSSAPSQTPEPPKRDAKDGGPTIRESRSYYAPATDGDRCHIDFRNLTGRGVTVMVGGQVHFLPRDRSVTLDLDREFAWRLDRHDLQVTRVPADRSTLTVFLRD